MLPKKLQHKLAKRQEEGLLRNLPKARKSIDFSSNDYLGFASAKALETRVDSLLKRHHITKNGSTGSRLLSGNHVLYEVAEEMISHFHESDTSLIFNSGYDANIGFFQSVPQRNDLIIYDEYIHASIRDGIQMSLARGYKFKHNNIRDLSQVLSRLVKESQKEDQSQEICLYVVTESVFSMDGDSPDLKEFIKICHSYDALLIVDEAHAVGVLGNSGQGLVQYLGLQEEIFARIVTFGKALGCHGAAILGSSALKNYLVNYARSLIYTTALPPAAIARIIAGYEVLEKARQGTTTTQIVPDLKKLVDYFNEQLILLELRDFFIESNSAIHCAIIPSNNGVKEVAQALQIEGYDVRPILSPTVPKGQERLRICLHTFNKKEEIDQLLSIFKDFVKP